MRLIEKPIEISVNPIRADSYYTGTVRTGNKDSARLNVPIYLLGKKVILIIMEEDKHE